MSDEILTDEQIDALAWLKVDHWKALQAHGIAANAEIARLRKHSDRMESEMLRRVSPHLVEDARKEIARLRAELAEMKTKWEGADKRGMIVLEAKDYWADRARRAEAELAEKERALDWIRSLKPEGGRMVDAALASGGEQGQGEAGDVADSLIAGDVGAPVPSPSPASPVCRWRLVEGEYAKGDCGARAYGTMIAAVMVDGEMCHCKRPIVTDREEGTE